MTALQLKRLRKRLGLSQHQLAQQLGLHWNSLARMERGERPITDSTAKHAQLLEEFTKLEGGSHGRISSRKG